MANKRSISTMRPTPSEKQRGPQSLPLRMENFGGAGKPESSKHFSAEIAAFASLWSVILGKRGLVFNSLTFSCYLASILCKNAEMPHFRAAFLLCIFFINTFWSEMGDSNSRPDGPKAGALPTALHPDMKLWGGPGVFSQKRFSAFFIVVYSNLSSFLLQPSYFLAILFPLFPCIPALSVVLHVVSGKVSARIPAPQ